MDNAPLSQMISTSLMVAMGVFMIGLLGALLRRNLLIVLMSIELMLNAANLVLVSFSQVHHALDGQIVVLFSMTIAAAEAAIGLSILVLLYRKTQNIFTDEHHRLKG